MAKKPPYEPVSERISFKIALREKQPEDEIPLLTATAIDAKGMPIGTDTSDADGKFNFSREIINAASKIVISAADAEPGEAAKSITLHTYQIAKAIEANKAIDIARRNWTQLRQLEYCIDGTARHCEWRPFLAQINNQRIALTATKSVSPVLPAASILEPVVASWLRCLPLCDGVVEVYRRTCCCPPLLIYDPRILEIIRELEELELREPPIGPPDPGPLRFQDVSFFAGGAANERAINASADLKAIKSLDPALQVEYIQARPYLFCSCGSSELVASGFLQPDGTFNICWREPLRLMWVRCHDEYAFVIKQLVDGETVKIYDGVAAGQWFHRDERIELTSYHPDAIVCSDTEEPPPGTTGTSVMLEAIRSTYSYDLNSPLPSGWDRVTSASGTEGTAFPAPSAGATVQWNNVGWGKTLPLRYLFYPDLEPIATYYRISVVACSTSGAPTGTRKYLTGPLSWVWYRRLSDLTIKRETLSLNTSVSNLYKIPYSSLFQALLELHEIGEWASWQFHGAIDTTQFPNGRHLVTLELFDADQNQIKPATAPVADPGTPAGFSFQTWDQSDLSVTVPVDYGALTHLFWWDNRQTKSKILAVNKDGAHFLDECLFLGGPRSTNVSIEYRAKHDEPIFLYKHDLRWKRGLFTSWQTWVAETADNVDPGTSPNRTYEQLLGTKDQCAFTIEVRTFAKITDGSSRVYEYDARDDGAFAIVSPTP